MEADMRGTTRTAFAATIVAATTAWAVVPGLVQAADLRVSVDAVKNDTGTIMVALHAPRGVEPFPAETGMVAAQWRHAAAGAIEFVFADLPPGRYAVAVFHDENGNTELDANAVGIPLEGYGFSEEATGNFGPPSFDQAAVEIGDDDQTTAVVLAY
jgi:uncharacterized protein (DUF2141 family)